MATVVRADLAAAMSLILQDRLVDQFRRDAVLLNLLQVKNGRNDALTWTVKFDARTAGGAYAEGADMADGDYDSHARAQATLPWAEYRKGAKVSGLAESVAGAGGYAGAMSLFEEELVDATDALALDLASDLYAGDPTASPVELAGAAVAIDGTAGTFAGIASATYGDWLAAENSMAEAAISLDTLRSNVLRPIRDAKGRYPDFATLPGNLFDIIVSRLQEKADVVTEVRAGRAGVINLAMAGGARAVSVDGVPFIEDRHCTANTIYGWTADDVEIQQVPAKTPRRDPKRIAAAIKMLTGADIEPAEIEERMRRGGVLVPTIEFLAQTGDAYKAMVKVYPQVKWKSRQGFSKTTIT